MCIKCYICIFHINIIVIAITGGMQRTRMHPLREELWWIQQDIQEIRRRHFYPGSSSHHALVS